MAFLQFCGWSAAGALLGVIATLFGSSITDKPPRWLPLVVIRPKEGPIRKCTDMSGFLIFPTPLSI